MSWFTQFRDSALNGLGLNNGKKAAKTIAKAAKQQLPLAPVKPQAPNSQTGQPQAPNSQPLPASSGGFSAMLQNPLMIAAVAGAIALYTGKK